MQALTSVGILLLGKAFRYGVNWCCACSTHEAQGGEIAGMCDSGEMHSQPDRSLGFAACAAAGALWGTGFYFGKIALRELSVGHMVLYRFLFALLPALPLAWRNAAPWSRRD